MIFKSYIIENNINLIDDCNVALFYGENEGLKNEFKKKIKKQFFKNEVLSFNQEEILKNHNVLINELTNRSLFNERKIIIIDLISDKIFELLESVLDNINNEKLFLFGKILDKRSKIRNYFEKTKNCAIIPCYQDNDVTIKKIITQELKNYQGLSAHLINTIIKSTGLDRDKVNNEIDKIKLCFKNRIIDLEKIDQLLNIGTNEDFNKLKDEAIKGNKINTNRLLTDTFFEADGNVFYLTLINQRLLKLLEIEDLKKNNKDVEAIISSLKPPVFWKDKPTLISQAHKWNKKKINLMLKKLYETEIQLKTNSTIRKDILVKNLILNLCSTANSALTN